VPLYEYHCKCGREREVILSLQESNQPQVCLCGKVMRKKISVSNFTMKQTGRNMALDTLNSNQVQGRHKKYAEKIAAMGL